MQANERDKDMLWAPEHIGPWWWMTEEPYIMIGTNFKLPVNVELEDVTTTLGHTAVTVGTVQVR